MSYPEKEDFSLLKQIWSLGKNLAKIVAKILLVVAAIFGALVFMALIADLMSWFVYLLATVVSWVCWLGAPGFCDGLNKKQPVQESLYGTQTYCIYDYERFVPRQLHLSLGNDSREIYVTWSTNDPVLKSRLIYKKYPDSSCEKVEIGNLTATEIEVDTTFSLPMPRDKLKRTLYNYRAKISNLEPGSQYIYRVESNALAGVMPNCRSQGNTRFSSSSYVFRATKLDDYNEPVTMAIFSDLGLSNGRSIGPLIKDVDEANFNLIIHNGESNLDTDGGKNGDKLMKEIEPIAARVPYQTSVGYHKSRQSIAYYDSRFTMINGGKFNHGERNNFFYSFNAGPVHFIAISTEFYYFLDSVGPEPIYRQYEWLTEDLKIASSPAERALRPWIIVFGHRPMYCSSNQPKDDCAKITNPLRVGLPSTGAYALEKLFYDFGVDLELYANGNQYERFLPLYNHKIYNGTDSLDDPYLNPRAPVHLISGAVGGNEDSSLFLGEPATGSIIQIPHFGYTIMSATRCKFEFTHVSSEYDRQVLDKFSITKSRQISFPAKSLIDLDCSGLSSFKVNI